MRVDPRSCVLLAAALLGSCAQACDLHVTEAWIREPTPGATTLAGYAQLSNKGSAPLSIGVVRSTLFARVEMHESVQSNGVMQMRPLPTLPLAPGTSVRFAPDGKHFMLVGPNRTLQRGDVVPIDFVDGGGCVTTAQFSVGTPASAAAAPAMPPGMNMGSMK